MNLENNITLKIKYHSQNKEEILNYIKNYNNVVKFTLKLLKRNFLLQKKIKIGGAIKNTECLEQASAEVSTS